MLVRGENKGSLASNTSRANADSGNTTPISSIFMPPIRNAAIIFTEIPLVGPPEAGVHFQYDDSRTIDLDTVRHRLVVRNLAFAIDPYLRHRMRDSTMDGFAEAYEIGEPLQGYVIGQVVRSQDPSYAIGTFVLGESGLEEYTLFDDVDSLRILTDNQISLNLPLSTWAGAAGMSGQAAFYGLYHIGKPRRGDTIYISGAASTVGQIAGQLAKMEGCKVVGSASTDEKVQFLKQIGFDHAFNSKSSLLATELSSIAPIHIYWDNIGGQHLSSAIAYAADYAKFVECGMVCMACSCSCSCSWRLLTRYRYQHGQKGSARYRTWPLLSPRGSDSRDSSYRIR